jgi:hypothetical protein
VGQFALGSYSAWRNSRLGAMMERLRRDVEWWLSYIPRLVGHFRNRRQLGQSSGLPSVAPGNECGSPDLDFSDHLNHRVGESEPPGPLGLAGCSRRLIGVASISELAPGVTGIVRFRPNATGGA